MNIFRIKLMTYWKDKQLECCCPIKNQCSKDKGCEELEFTLDPYDGVRECMMERSYKRSKGAIKQK